jgi:RimJ/RimL family protein N-acetyltransferase
MTCAVPVIESEDLILRGYREEDYIRYHEFAASERSYLVGGPQNAADSWRSFLAGIGHWALRGYGMWVVEDRATHLVAGRVGVIYNDGWHEPEMAWHIYDGFEGRSVAYAASLLARDYSARHFGLDRTMSYISSKNKRSLRLAKRLGCVFERNVKMRNEPVEMWRHPSVLEGAA